jgi:hypothetical protein
MAPRGSHRKAHDLRQQAMMNHALAPTTPGDAFTEAAVDSPVTPETPLYYLNM